MSEIKKQENQNQNEDQDRSKNQEQVNPLNITFKKPYEFEGKTYHGIDLSGLENMTGKEYAKIEKMLRMIGVADPNPETTAEGVFLYAAEAGGIPVEFFDTIPLREAAKIKRVLINFLWKNKTESDNPLEIFLERNHEFKGKTYESIDLSGLENMTGKQFIEIGKVSGEAGITNINPEMTPEGAFIYASQAAGVPIDFFYSLPLKEARKVKVTVINFLWF